MLRKHMVILLIFIGIILPGLVSAATPRNDTMLYPEVNVDVWVPGGAWFSVDLSDLDSGDMIYVEVEVTSGGGIDFFICDQTNYDILIALGEPYRYGQQEDVGSVFTSFSVPSYGTWYCVFINEDLLTSKHLEGYVGQNPQYSGGGVFLLMAVFGIIFILGVIYAGVKHL